MNIFVTGGCGRLGRYVVEAFLDRADGRSSYAVTILDNAPSPVVPSGARFVHADVTDLEQVMRAATGADAIVHLAAIPQPGVAPDEVLFRTNVLGTFNVHEAASRLGIGRVVSTSSEAALGWDYRHRDFIPDYLPIDEDHPLRPQDAYGLSKQVGEDIARSFSARRGLVTVVLRPPWVVLPDMLEELRRSGGRPATRFTTGSYVDARDAADAYRSAVEAPLSGHSVFFIVADDTVVPEPLATLMPRLEPSIGDMARGLVGTKPSVRNDRAKAALGWRPRRSWRPATALAAGRI